MVSWGRKSWPQTPQVIGPGVCCLARIQNDRGGWQPQATLNRSPGLPGRLPVAVLTSLPTILPVAVASAADQTQAAEGIAVQRIAAPR